MRKLHLLIFLLVFFLQGQNVWAAINETDHYYCGFETEADFAQWTKTDLNGKDYSGNSDVWWDSDWQAAMFNPGTSLANDEWLVSPSVTLTGGKTYTLKVKMFIDYPGKLAFAMGKGTSPDDMTTEISATQNYNGGNYYLSITVPGTVEQGTYNFGIHCTTGGWYGPVYVQSFEVTAAANVNFTGTVIDNEQQSAVQGATVRLSSATYKQQERESDSAGQFSFENLSAGTYTISIERDGFNSLEQQVSIAATTATQTFQLEKKSTADLSGRVVDEAGNAVKAVKVKLEGSNSYEVTTNDNGEFSIPQVRRLEKYTLSITRNWKEDYQSEIDVQGTSVNLGDLVLKTYVADPQNLQGEVVESGSLLSWQMPVRRQEFALDNGTYGGTYQFTGLAYNQVGNEFDTPMVVEGMKWLLSSESAATDAVDLRVYALNRDGSRSDNILYEKENVANQNYQFDGNAVWNEYTFEAPVVAPYGCVATVGCKGAISVCADYSGNGHSLVMQDGSFRVSNVSTFFIRVKGSSLASTPQPASVQAASALRCVNTNKINRQVQATDEAAPTYEVYRFKSADKDKATAWEKIEDGFTSMSYVDRGFDALEAGYYRYAVKAVYGDGKTSEAVVSEELPNKVFTAVKVQVTTNTAVDFSEGAAVTLTSESTSLQTYTAVVAKGVAEFTKVPKGYYTIHVSKAGFEDLTQTGNNFSANTSCEASVQLQLVPKKPFNLEATQQPGDVTLSWNSEDGIADGFEDMDAFEVNPAGTLGWTYADVDGAATYGVSRCEASPYENMYAAMAFMSFDPSATSPNVLDLVQPHSGKQMLIDVSLANGGVNNDYMFSPELSFDDDLVLEFHAASGFYAAMGEEEFMVGYTTTADAKPENVVWLTSEPQTVGAVWTQFSYQLPKEAKHTVIRCVSDQHMFFMLDDIFIGQREAETFAMTTFNVVLDEEEVGTTSERTFNLGSLSSGRHLAKVQTVYPMADGSKSYSDFAELVFTVGTTTGIEPAQSGVMFTLQDGVLTTGSGVERMSLYDVQGRLVAQCDPKGTVETSGLSAGVYLVKVTTGGQTSLCKILVR